jgi:hypothetical protein
MDYLFENLDDKRFQEFCSTLVSKEFSNVQSLPVGQPDGGRDVLSYSMTSSKKGFIVFQVKYVRNPKSIKDVHKWLVDTMKDEIPKVKTLIPKGAISYYLITNVNGTAHLDSGSIDKMNSFLEQEISIPSVCWWRDDLCRLVEKDPIFKWSFPQIINGQDMLNSILFQNINENKERRESIIKAYLVDQYEIDNEVKFKQIDLKNKLFSLYTDIPINIKKYNTKNRVLSKFLHSTFRNSHFNRNDNFLPFDEGEDLNAAEFLLNSETQEKLKRILLEGGPGQGKSTISQYICQIHRARLLNKKSDIKLFPVELKKSPLRLPIKIDLRHVADWVDKKNPYSSRLSDEFFSSIWRKSLESFLVGHIIYHSQLESFTSSDLVAITKFSSILIVFDGFDEIANVKIREEVIDFIDKGVIRLSENSKSLQVIVTSRPAAFSNSVGFPVKTYPHFQLSNITNKTIDNYVKKWIKASKLNEREASDIKKLVNEKLELPHLRDLAKSPMQLAIFISLLRTKGESLPNKRTALYDSYIELFFNRESEKSKFILTNRDLIIDIHQYLAWVLHSEAESKKSSGIINIEKLKLVLKEYLELEGHDPNIADELFDIVKERVCALVSRVQGTFEFEVQPLREYFCAKFLYKTSPYSPAGFEKSGTKTDRFDAISRSFYWNNVVRFFTGCFDKGELPMLILKLKELQDDELLKYTNFPRLLTSQILSDWVFTQYPKLKKEVVKIIIDGVNIGILINQAEDYGNNESIMIPEECGREELVEESFKQLSRFPPYDSALELIGIIKNNSYNKLEFWLNYLDKIDKSKITDWLRFAYKLEIIHKIEPKTLNNIIKQGDAAQKENRIEIITDAGRMEIIDKIPEFKEILFESVLACNNTIFNRNTRNSSLAFISMLTYPYNINKLLKYDTNNKSFIDGIKMSPYLSFGRRSEQNYKFLEFEVRDNIDKKIELYKNTISSIIETPLIEWQNNIELWETFVEEYRKLFGDTRSIKMISVLSASVKDKEVDLSKYNSLNDNKISLVKRVRKARLKSGDLSYWKTILKENINIEFNLLIILTWGTPRILTLLLEELNPKLEELSSTTFYSLYNSMNLIATINKLKNNQIKLINDAFKNNKASSRLLLLISKRIDYNERGNFLFEENKCEHEQAPEFVLEFQLHFLIEKFYLEPKNKNLLLQIKDIYSRITVFRVKHLYSPHHINLREKKMIPYKVAKKIMKKQKEYPRMIVSEAEISCKRHAEKNITPVGIIAIKQKWFD